jgi:aldehyde:ferredoxin oxidoreductase
MEFGYSDKILRVNLSNDKISIEHPEDIFYRKYIGGEGFVAYYLLKELKPKTDPLGPENKLILATGPITGVSIAGAGRNSIGAKSPLTNGFGEAEVGGYWGPELKRAGFDAIIVEGKAKSPIFLWIKNGNVEIRDASHIWGKTTGEAQKIIKKELDDKLVHISQIGPGGENLVRYACVINDLRSAAGRTGMGAVMGSKNLKAVVVRGNKRPKVANKEKLRELRNSFSNNYLNNHKEYFSHGTGGGVMEMFASMGNLPTHNFKAGGISSAKALDPKINKEEIDLKMETCFACPIKCKKIVQFKEPWVVDPEYGGPEYETLAAFGSNCGIYDLKAVCKANELCNKYSIDTISTGMSISFAMECFENNILNESDTGGIILKFGNSEAMIQMIEKIAKREGLGDVLAEGVKRAAEKIQSGAQEFAIHVKGQELPMHEPRLKQGLGLGYTISPTGAEHMHNLHDTVIANEGSIANFNTFGILTPLRLDDLSAKKVRALIYQMNWGALGNALVMCYFVPWNSFEQTEIVRAVTGWNTSTFELMKVGERIMNMTRIFNLREGFTSDDDRLPDRFFQPHTSGALAETSIDLENFSEAKKIYYEMMGWDKNGVPSKIKLDELDISWANSY